MGDVEVNAYIFAHSKDSNSKRRSYLNTNTMGKEFLEHDSYLYCVLLPYQYSHRNEWRIHSGLP